MHLKLTDSNMILNVDFGYWLIPHIRATLVKNILKYNFINWDNYFNDSNYFKKLYDKPYKTRDIIIFAANNLVCKGFAGKLIIEFNNNKFVYGFDRLKLSTATRTINYGTLDVKACPIFTDTLNYFAENIDQYIKLYYLI